MLEISAPRLLEQLEKVNCCWCWYSRNAGSLHDVTCSGHAPCYVQGDVCGVGHAWRCAHCHVLPVCLCSAQSGSPVDSEFTRRTIQPCADRGLNIPLFNSTVLDKWTSCGGLSSCVCLSPSLSLTVRLQPLSLFPSAPSPPPTDPTAAPYIGLIQVSPSGEATPTPIPTAPFISLPLPFSLSPPALPLVLSFRVLAASSHAVLAALQSAPSTISSSSSSETPSVSLGYPSNTRDYKATSCHQVTSHGRQCPSKDSEINVKALASTLVLSSRGRRVDFKTSTPLELRPSRDRVGDRSPTSRPPPLQSREREVNLKASASTFTSTHRLKSTLDKTRNSKLRETVARIVSAVMVLLLSTTAAAAYKLKPTTTISRVALAGTTGKLPCELPVPADRPTLILWYKDEATKPFYSFDARETSRGHHKVHDNSRLGKRSRFTLETLTRNFRSRMGFLEVENLTLADAGNYTCRVDFMTSQTMMALLQLTVHEEIRSLEIFDSYETMISQVVGPYELSSRVVLSCRAYGGYPTPVVRWLSGSEEEMLESSWSQPQQQQQYHFQDEGASVEGIPFVTSGSSGHSEVSYQHRHRQTEQGLSVVTSKLLLPSLTREDHGRQLKCVAGNTNLTQDRSRLVTIEMYLPPLEVEIEGVETPLRAGVEATLTCRSSGSRPPAVLAWQIDGPSRITPLPPHSTLDQNIASRRGRLLPTPKDNGRTVTCTATNPKVSQYSLSASTLLSVQYAPEVMVRLAPALDPNNIEEGDDVYFECQITANPPESRILWLHQGRRLHTDREQGVLAQGRNLVLQKVRREHRGDYQCVVTNAVDTVTSAPTVLDVMFLPECREPRNVTVSVTATEEVTLDCVVESNPEEVQFLWKVNSSRGVKDLPPTSFTTRGSTSTLVYRPHTHSHAHDKYGIVFCLGRNRLGSQRVPCVFFITPAGPPEEPSSCTLVNQSATSLAVTCTPGHDGGLKQHFVTTVRDAATQELVANVSSATPTFVVGGLAPGRDYLLLVTAVNLKGSSSPYVIQDFALKVAENKINNSSSTESSPLLAVFVGVVSGFVFILTVLAVATRSRCRRQREDLDEDADNNKLRGGEEVPASPSTKASLDEAEDADDELNTPESRDGPLKPQEFTAQTAGSPTSSASRTYVAVHPQQQSQPQPLHSVDLPHINANNHKYYKIKIDCTRLSNESFV
ncbi:uncharacterized protein [Cherax quadricarinatus]